MVNDEKKVITLKKVLYVPGLGKNLLSIAVVTNLGWNVTIATSGCLSHQKAVWS
jgi:hypothetical protein